VLKSVVWPKRDFGVLVDLDKCSGCGKCVEACKTRNGTIYELKQKTFSPSELTGTTWLSLKRYKHAAIPYRCFHCYSAVCALVCPVDAHFVTDYGAVVINQNKCIGCGRCATVCCYNTPRLGLDRRYKKCDLCVDRITQGKQPACVEACPTGALRFGPIQDIYRQAREEETKGRKTYGVELTHWVYVYSDEEVFRQFLGDVAQKKDPKKIMDILAFPTERGALPPVSYLGLEGAVVATALIAFFGWRSNRLKEKKKKEGDSHE